MNDNFDSVLDAAAAAAGAQHGMTAAELLHLVAVGEEGHPDAPDEVCGIRDPRSSSSDYWCLLPPGHAGSHNRYSDADFDHLRTTGRTLWSQRWADAAARRQQDGRP